MRGLAQQTRSQADRFDRSMSNKMRAKLCEAGPLSIALYRLFSIRWRYVTISTYERCRKAESLRSTTLGSISPVNDLFSAMATGAATRLSYAADLTT
jgi:hypothetical protein